MVSMGGCGDFGGGGVYVIVVDCRGIVVYEFETLLGSFQNLCVTWFSVRFRRFLPQKGVFYTRCISIKVERTR